MHTDVSSASVILALPADSSALVGSSNPVHPTFTVNYRATFYGLTEGQRLIKSHINVKFDPTKIVETGTHNNLRNASGVYAQLAAL